MQIEIQELPSVNGDSIWNRETYPEGNGLYWCESYGERGALVAVVDTLVTFIEPPVGFQNKKFSDESGQPELNQGVSEQTLLRAIAVTVNPELAFRD